MRKTYYETHTVNSSDVDKATPMTLVLQVSFGCFGGATIRREALGETAKELLAQIDESND